MHAFKAYLHHIFFDPLGAVDESLLGLILIAFIVLCFVVLEFGFWIHSLFSSKQEK